MPELTDIQILDRMIAFLTPTADEPELALDTELVIDNFAGGGGASLGITNALGRSPDYAINHDEAALEMHAANHPLTEHLPEDVWDVDPLSLVAGRSVALAWFSPDCKHFSRAKGGKPKDKRIRSLAWVAVKWAKLVRPRVIMLENVREFEEWGPLRPDGKLNPEKKGITFRRFVGYLRGQGYNVEWRMIDAARYGAPTHRKRLFLIARCDGQPIVWPAPTHGAKKHRSMFHGELKPYRTAAECVDWTRDLDGVVRSARIRSYIDRTCEARDGDWILSYYGNLGNCGVDRPLPTITTRDRFALVDQAGRMRMLTPRELARAQGFPDDYVLTGTKTNQVAKIGNSVAPPVVKTLVSANLGRSS